MRRVTARAGTALVGAVLVGGAAMAFGQAMEPTGPATPAAALSAPARADALTRVPGTVLRVVDGDTIHVRTATAPDLDVRIVGLNAPESVPPRPKGCGGQAASALAKDRLKPGTAVDLVVDPKVRSSQPGAVPPLDRYGRTLAMVETGGRNFGLDAVTGGFAEFNDYGTKLTLNDQFVAAQRDAQAAKRGIWGTTKGAPGEPGSGAVCTPQTSYGR